MTLNAKMEIFIVGHFYSTLFNLIMAKYLESGTKGEEIIRNSAMFSKGII